MLLTASLIHDGEKFLPEGSVLEIAADGRVIAIHEYAYGIDTVRYEGILCPGFVNVHCHLELSHMKGLIPEHTGLIPFLQNIPARRNDFTDEQITTARRDAYEELVRNGVVAVGDIANVPHTKDVRALDELHVHTFVECIGFTEERAAQAYAISQSVFNEFAAQTGNDKLLRQSIVPHAPYSVSGALFKLIDAQGANAVLSIHNQESKAENEFYEHGTGGVTDLLGGFGIDYNGFQPSGKTSLQTYGNWLSASHPLILVHNTQAAKEDIMFAKARFPKVHFCLCPNANLYIENRLPDVAMLRSEQVNICIGTDSLASNHQLSIVAELHTLHRQCGIDWETLLQWGTSNGAAALQMKDIVGSFTPGRRPGVVLLNDLDQVPSVRRIM